jgi:hypothetical protein
MKVLKFSGAQKAYILKHCDQGLPVADLSLDREMLQDAIRRKF